MSLKIKAKFQCVSVTDYGSTKEAKFSAVYSSTGENADFAKATPSGSLSIMVDKDTLAADFYQPKKSYYLTFEEAPE